MLNQICICIYECVFVYIHVHVCVSLWVQHSSVCVCAGNHMPQHTYGGKVGVSLHLLAWLGQTGASLVHLHWPHASEPWFLVILLYQLLISPSEWLNLYRISFMWVLLTHTEVFMCTTSMYFYIFDRWIVYNKIFFKSIYCQRETSKYHHIVIGKPSSSLPSMLDYG